MAKRKKIIIISASIITIVLIGFAVFMLFTQDGRKIRKNLNLGYKCLQELNYDAAIAAFNDAIAIDPKNVEAYEGLAEAYEGLEEYEKAVEVLEKGLAEVQEKGKEKLEKRLEKDREEIEKKKKELEEEIANNEQAKAFLANRDINDRNDPKIAKIKQVDDLILQPYAIEEPKEKIDSINGIIEFWKYGRSCNGLTHRYGSIQNGQFLTATEPIRSKDQEVKNKTPNFNGAVGFKEYKNGNYTGEWTSNKPYRLRVNYTRPENGERSVFYLYFVHEENLNIAYDLYFGGKNSATGLRAIKKSTIQESGEISEVCGEMNQLLDKSYRKQGVEKMMNVKDKLRSKRVVLNKMKQLSEANAEGIKSYACDAIDEEKVEEAFRSRPPVEKSEPSVEMELIQSLYVPYKMQNEDEARRQTRELRESMQGFPQSKMFKRSNYQNDEDY